MEKIGIFCSASENIDKMYFESARQIGEWMGQKGKTLIYGGASLGLMECVARAVKENGGTVIGVVPAKLEEKGSVSTLLDEVIHTRNLSDRKDVITEKSDSYTIKMSVTEEQRRYIEKGDKVTVQMDDSGVNTEVSAVYSNVENGQGYIVEAVVPGDTFDVGDSVLAEISHQSEKYGSVVSMSAIHADVSGSYVLVERPKDTLLGTEYVAEKVYVTVGDTNNYDAGLKKSPFTGDDKIIVSSDKKVEAGDTVREK